MVWWASVFLFHNNARGGLELSSLDTRSGGPGSSLWKFIKLLGRALSHPLLFKVPAIYLGNLLEFYRPRGIELQTPPGEWSYNIPHCSMSRYIASSFLPFRPVYHEIAPSNRTTSTRLYQCTREALAAINHQICKIFTFIRRRLDEYTVFTIDMTCSS